MFFKKVLIFILFVFIGNHSCSEAKDAENNNELNGTKNEEQNIANEKSVEHKCKNYKFLLNKAKQRRHNKNQKNEGRILMSHE